MAFKNGDAGMTIFLIVIAVIILVGVAHALKGKL